MKNFHPNFCKLGLFLAIAAGLILVLTSWNVQAAAALPVNAASATTIPTALPATSPTPAATPASEPTAAVTPTQTIPSPHTSGDCLACHGNQNMLGKLPSGETVSLYVAPVVDESSYHTQKGIGCGFCHQDQETYPHKGSDSRACAICHTDVTGSAATSGQMVFDLPFADARAMTLVLNDGCRNCHSDRFDEVKGSAHTRIMNEGNRFAPVCVDCHSSHDIKTITRISETQICSKCHLAEYSAYSTSVHGEALVKEFNHDVPTCENCHGSHVVTGPAEDNFRAEVATQICGKCHADKALMSKYGLSTEILSTYLDDVHGRTDLLGRVDTTGITKATCYDCHGTHNILSPTNPQSTVYPANLQKTCQQCHKDASITFPQTWLSHKTPSQSSMPGLYLTNQISLGAIILMIAVTALFILMDLRQRKAAKLLTRTRREE